MTTAHATAAAAVACFCFSALVVLWELETWRVKGVYAATPAVLAALLVQQPLTLVMLGHGVSRIALVSMPAMCTRQNQPIQACTHQSHIKAVV
jgi:hypothetical protein